MNIALILAGGVGARLDKATPKQFLLYDGKPILTRCAEAFDNNPQIDKIAVVIKKDRTECAKAVLSGIKKPIIYVFGGDTRTQSARNGLAAIDAADDDIVLIHDAARPFVSDEIIARSIETAEKFGAAVTAVSSTDAVFTAENSELGRYLNRENVYLVQTPQSFKYSLIRAAYDAFPKDETAVDDGAVVQRFGVNARIVTGSPSNRKITVKEDLKP